MPFGAPLFSLFNDPKAALLKPIEGPLDIVDDTDHWRPDTVDVTVDSAYLEEFAAGDVSVADINTAPLQVHERVTRNPLTVKRLLTHTVTAATDLTQEQVDKASKIGEVMDLLNIAQAIPAQAIKRTRNLHYAALLVFGIQGSTIPAAMAAYLDTLAGDNLSLFNEAHTYPGSAVTWRNIALASLDFTEDALTTVFQDLGAILTDQGIPTMIKPDHVEIAYNLFPKARKVLDSQYEPNTGNNAINTARVVMLNLSLTPNKYLPNDYWFVHSDVGKDFKIRHVGQARGGAAWNDFSKDNRGRTFGVYMYQNFQPPNQPYGIYSAQAKVS